MTEKQVTSSLFITIGIVTAIYSAGGIPIKGLLLFILTAIFNNIEGLIVRKLKNVEAQTFLFYKNVIIVGIVAVVVLIKTDLIDFTSVSLEGYIIITLLSVNSFIGSYYLYKSFQSVGVVSTNLVLSFSPVISTTLLCLVYVQSIPLLLILSLVFVTMGALTEVFSKSVTAKSKE